jgi:hypothetical protein
VLLRPVGPVRAHGIQQVGAAQNSAAPRTSVTVGASLMTLTFEVRRPAVQATFRHPALPAVSSERGDQQPGQGRHTLGSISAQSGGVVQRRCGREVVEGHPFGALRACRGPGSVSNSARSVRMAADLPVWRRAGAVRMLDPVLPTPANSTPPRPPVNTVGEDLRDGEDHATARNLQGSRLQQR